MKYEAEPIIKAVLAKLAAELAAALDVVETEWAADPITLDDVQTENFLFGFRPTLLDREEAGFPVISVFGTGSGPGGVQADQWYGQASYDIFLDIVVCDRDEAKVSKKTLRFLEAVMSILGAGATLSTGALQEDYVPTTEVNEVMRQLDSQSNEFFTQQSRTALKVVS